MRVLGIEGTAWAASAAIYDSDLEEVTIRTDPFRPPEGGIDPSEAAEHMSSALPEVIAAVLADDGGEIDAIAFARGPGLGPCLRVTATAARSLAIRLDAPLVGVNHMVAHLEVGRHLGELDDPIGLNASGANAHVLGFRNGRYRVLGETMDTGVGNAIDKFTRYLGWSHPGGPKVERHAAEGEYVELPYVVKGMDFSFAGLSSAAQQLVDEGVAIEDVCCGLQETIFAMLTEVTERALALTYRDEVVLGGGVAQNARLQEMITEMAEARGASVYIPPARFLRDNAGMIAITGAYMHRAGEHLAVDASTCLPEYRPEAVPITWREEPTHAPPTRTRTQQGAEAIIESLDGGRLRKRRAPKSYRHPTLDASIRRQRTIREARLLHRSRRCGIPTPVVLDIDLEDHAMVLTAVGSHDLRDSLSAKTVERVGRHLATMHEDIGFVHGDPTVRNVRVDEERVYLIDFGLGFRTDDLEDWAMDLHIFLQSLQDVTDTLEPFRVALLKGYTSVSDVPIADQLDEIEGRGRYR